MIAHSKLKGSTTLCKPVNNLERKKLTYVDNKDQRI